MTKPWLITEVINRTLAVANAKSHMKSSAQITRHSLSQSLFIYLSNFIETEIWHYLCCRPNNAFYFLFLTIKTNSFCMSTTAKANGCLGRSLRETHERHKYIPVKSDFRALDELVVAAYCCTNNRHCGTFSKVKAQSVNERAGALLRRLKITSAWVCPALPKTTLTSSGRFR